MASYDETVSDGFDMSCTDIGSADVLRQRYRVTLDYSTGGGGAWEVSDK